MGGIEVGVESFYVKMKCIQIDDIQAVIEKYHNCLDFSVNNDYFCVSGALVSFFSATKLIYNICCRIKECPLFINSLDQESCFNFESYLDFMDWMYKIWQKKLEYFDENFGAFVIKPSEYYRDYRKLQKKYYRKI